MRTKWLWIGALAPLLLAGCEPRDTPASAPAQPAAPAGAQLVRIGHVAPLSGAQAHYGRDNENGVRMAIAELNAQDLRIGGQPVRFALVAEDDGGDPRQGATAAQKLCDQRVAGVVGHLNSGTTLPAARVYADCGIPHITPSASNPAITEAGHPTSFRLIADDNALGAAVARYAAGPLGIRRVAVVDDRTAYGQGVAEVFRQTAESLGLEIVDQQYTTDRAIDFTPILTAIKARQPDAIFFGGLDPQGGPLLRQMAQLGMTQVKVLGGDGICTNEIAKLAAGAPTLENVVCATGGTPVDRMPGGAAWKQKYDARYPGQFQLYSPYAYDAVFVLVQAMQRAGSTDPRAYLPQLAGTDYQGVTARIRFAPDGSLLDPATTLHTYRKGERVALE